MSKLFGTQLPTICIDRLGGILYVFLVVSSVVASASNNVAFTKALLKWSYLPKLCWAILGGGNSGIVHNHAFLPASLKKCFVFC